MKKDFTASEKRTMGAVHLGIALGALLGFFFGSLATVAIYEWLKVYS